MIRMLTERYAGKTLWTALKLLLENPPKGSGAQYRQYLGAVKTLDSAIKHQGLDASCDRFVKMTDQAIFDNYRGAIQASDLVAFRMEFGGGD